jgi:hypothetical protein
MKLRRGGTRVKIALAALWLLGGACAYTDLPRRVGDCLLTFYTQPRELHRGEARVALRVQDRDYQVLTAAHVSLVVAEPDGNSRPAVDLALGAAKDYRVRVAFPAAGEYRLAFEVFPRPGGSRLISVYRVRVSE